jgi:DNA-binding CsgD family transcriptional regulator
MAVESIGIVREFRRLNTRFGTIHKTTEREVSGGSEVQSLLLALDTLDCCLAFHDGMGRLQYGNRAYVAELATAPDADVLSLQISEFAQVVAGMAAAARLGSAVQRLAERSTNSSRGSYQLQGTYIGIELFTAGPSMLISVTCPRPDPCSEARMRHEFSLTRAQARVARLLAQGLRNDEIAQRLFLSEHTVRHHLEQIRVKVGGHTRAAVVNRLRSDS